MRVELLPHAFDPFAELSRQQQAMKPGSHGACASFTGDMRDNNSGREVTAMDLEHFPGMTEEHLLQIAQAASKRWGVLDLLLLHRTGRVEPGDTIVLTAAWAAHREAAFAAARFMIEDLKSRAPFWKKEYTPEGEHWVKGNTPPPAAAEQWYQQADASEKRS